jgi:hypothetical protein
MRLACIMDSVFSVRYELVVKITGDVNIPLFTR